MKLSMERPIVVIHLPSGEADPERMGCHRRVKGHVGIG